MVTWVIIPAYNEGKGLKNLLEELKRRQLAALVVDDGSRDDTFAIARDNATVVLRNERNLGKGVSLSKAIEYLLKNKQFDCVITMDADNQHSPSDIDAFLQEISSGESFVIGNRMHNPEGMPVVRIWTNKFMSWLVSKIIKQSVPDTQCGFRSIRRDVFEKIHIKTSKFEVESEILINAARNNFAIKSIPIKSIYFRHNASKIHPFFDTLRFVRFIMKLKRDRT